MRLVKTGGRALPLALSILTSTACCARAGHESRPGSYVVEKAPTGRWRQGDFHCAVGEVESIAIRVEPPYCAARVIDPPPLSDGRAVIERDPPRDPPPRRTSCALGMAVACATTFGGDLDAHLLLCRDAAGFVDGPIELVGSDGSLLEHTFCSAGRPVGPRVVWRRGQIFSVSATDPERRGVRIDGGRYLYPGQATNDER
ncbi:MAG: hypothetical protein IPL61_36480 [Myxococcales bacterium]|nr:hypothetical protein [Myxococcales bacterium]